MQEAIRALLRVKRILDSLNAINRAALTEIERQAVQECLSQAYDRAAYFTPQVEQLLAQEAEPAQEQPILNGRIRA